MYRPYTTIGTNKYKKFFTTFWILAVAVSRGAYCFYGRIDVFPDAYGLFARAMIRLEEGDPYLDSGLAYAYTKSISKLLKFAGNRIDAVIAYQMVLQVLWLVLLFAGISLLFGYMAGAVTGSILALSPWILSTMSTVWPGNYYMLHFSVALVLLGYFGHRAGKEGWFANDLGRLILAATGFYVGVLCIWNIFGVLLAFVMIYILIRNYSCKKREKYEKKSHPEEEPEAKRRAMGAGTQAIVLAEGILIGIFATLMKYTGVTGEAIVSQAMWWLSQLRDPFAQYKEVQIPFILWLLCAATAGIFFQLLINRLQKKKKTPSEEKVEVQGEPGKYIVTEDGRRIKLLDNPLPGPKKHVRREMDFDLEIADEVEAEDDFDFKIKDDDDFDIE